VATKLIEQYSERVPTIAADWIRWRDHIIPQSDDVNEYMDEHPPHVPFQDILSGSESPPVVGEAHGILSACTASGTSMRTVESTSSVIHIGQRRRSTPARILVMEADGSAGSRRGVLPSMYPSQKRLSATPVVAVATVQHNDSNESDDSSDSDIDSEKPHSEGRVKHTYSYEERTNWHDTAHLSSSNVLSGS